MENTKLVHFYGLYVCIISAACLGIGWKKTNSQKPILEKTSHKTINTAGFTSVHDEILELSSPHSSLDSVVNCRQVSGP